ncbi:MAG TPA: hypothetical protein VNZ45_11845 [Bacteroidia bacterium]|jgi:hypothetical protein|nr:hypothetical protein [Bacteroidia bacterium]
MEWYFYVSGFFAGAFFANFIPHFVKGSCGDFFPTPFSKPPGKGPSSPMANVLWSLLNLVLAYVLYRAGKVSLQDNLALAIFFAGFALKSILGARNFAKKEKM